MKLRSLAATAYWLLAAIFSFPALAETALNGEIKLDERLYSESSPQAISWNRASLALKVSRRLADQAAGYAELKLRTEDGPRISSLSDLASKNKVTPHSLELYEAYLDLFAYPFANTDLRAGKQRIAWGTADKLNQTDNLNPYDFSDFLEFGGKIPTNAVKLTSYLGGTTLTLIALPLFTPAAMPATFDTLLTGYVTAAIPPGLNLGSLETAVTLPAPTLDNAMYAVKAGRNLWGLDMSLSYFKGYDSLPNLSNLTLTAVSTTQVNAALGLNYPAIQAIGYDLAGSFQEIGFWLEVAAFTPDRASQTVISPLGAATTEVGPYTKYTLGWDYTFPADVYCNQQYMRGFFDERGADLTDLFITRLEKKVFDDKVKLSFSWLAEYDSGVVGNLFGPGVAFYPADATEIELGAFNIAGEPGSKLSTWQTLDQLFIRFKYSF